MLAPLAGYSDLPFRSMIKKFSVDITVSEMISSYALNYNSKKTLKMIEKSPLETPFSVQIAGNKVEVVQKSVEILNAQNGIDIIDLNCGCPAPKVSSHGNGSGLLKDLNLLVAIAQMIKKTSKKPYTSLKVRLGFDKKIPKELARAINDSGADFVVIHARTKTDAYKKDRIDYGAIAQMGEILNIPYIANGEIDSVKKAKEVLNLTGANGLMIGRAAIKEPWIFSQIAAELGKKISLDSIKKRDIVMEHFENMISFYGERGVVMFRKNLHNYARSYPNASEFRVVVNNISDSRIMREKIFEFFCDNLG